MKATVADVFGQINGSQISKEAMNDPYIQAFAQKMMDLSNRLNEVLEEENAELSDSFDIADDYLPALREFIANTTGL